LVDGLASPSHASTSTANRLLQAGLCRGSRPGSPGDAGCLPSGVLRPPPFGWGQWSGRAWAGRGGDQCLRAGTHRPGPDGREAEARWGMAAT
jgi:hypothetical protein